MTSAVSANFKATGPRGVPKGLVDAKNSGNGNSP